MKKSISILLILCIVFTGIMPNMAYANDGDEELPFIQIYPESDTTWYTEDVIVTITGNNVEYKSKNIEDDNEPEWQNYTGEPLQYTQEGSFVLDAKSDDEPEITTYINIDKTNPILTVHAVNVWRNDYATIEFEVTDPIGTSDIISGFDKIVLKDGDSDIEVELDYDESDGVYTSSYKVYANGGYTYYALDKAGNKSENLLVNVNTIDKISPLESPYIDYVDSQTQPINGWFTGSVGLKLDYSRIETQPNSESPQRPQYSFDNNTWMDYKNVEYNNPPIEISIEGESNVYAITRDSATNKSEPEILTVKIDNTAPSLVVTGNSDSWTNNDVILTLDANDEHSGVANLYKRGEEQPLQSNTLTFQENTNSSFTFYAKDNAGNESDDCKVDVKIDKDKPNAPTILDYKSEWTSEDVVITISKVDAPENQSPEKRQYSTDGGLTWTDIEDFGEVQGDNDTFSVSKEGEYDVLVRTLDQAENSSPINTISVKIDKTYPVITDVDYKPDDQNPGKGIISFTISDSPSGIFEKKYSIKQEELDYFEENNGIVIDGSSFTIDGADDSDGGQYTIYAKDYAGNVTLLNVHENINTYPLIDSIDTQEILEDAPLQTIEITGISDNESSQDELNVEYVYFGDILENISLVYDDNGTATLKYKPKENANGENEEIIIKVTHEDDELTSSITVIINVEAVDDVPVPVDDEINCGEGDTEVNIVVFGDENDDYDIESESVYINRYTEDTDEGGTIRINSEGNGFIYNPVNENFSGTDTFQYGIRDFEDADQDNGLANEPEDDATVTIHVQNEKDVPVALDDNYLFVKEDEVVNLDVLENDYDYDIPYVTDEKLDIVAIKYRDDNDDEITVEFDDDTQSVDVRNGKVEYYKVGDENPKLKFTPKLNYFGNVDFDYVIADTDDQQAEASVHVEVISVNDEPEFYFNSRSYEYNEDSGQHQIEFYIKDVEIEDPSGMTIRAISGDQSIISNADIVLTYVGEDEQNRGIIHLDFQAKENAFGQVAIDLQLSDLNVVTDDAIDITITSDNDIPTADNHIMYYYEDQVNEFDINDSKRREKYSDIEDEAEDLLAAIEPFDDENVGKMVKNDDGTYTFTPIDNYDENIELEYTLTDTDAGVATGNIILIAISNNDAPTIEADINEYQTLEDEEYGFLPGESGFDTAGANELIEFTIDDIDNEISDLKITFKSSNEELVLPKDIDFKFDEIDDNKLYAKIKPNLNQPDKLEDGIEKATAIITLTVSDGKKQTEFQFNFHIVPQQDVPVAVDDAVNVAYNGFTNIFPLENDYDFDLDDIHIDSVTPSDDGGEVTWSSDKIIYTAKANFVGEDIITYTISDNHEHTNAEMSEEEIAEIKAIRTGKIVVTVGGDNVAPEIDHILDVWGYEDTDAAAEFNIIDPDISPNFSEGITFEFGSSNPDIIDLSEGANPDTDGSITRSVTEVDGKGKVILTLKPKANQSGTSIITVKITDDAGGTDTALFTYTVYSVNDAPVVVDDYYTILEDATDTDDANIISPIDDGSDDHDFDYENDELTLISVSNNKHGYIEFIGNNEFRYYPDENFNDGQLTDEDINIKYTEVLDYVVSDGNEQSEGKIYINVEPVNDPPVAVYNSKYVADGSTIDLNGTYDIRENDTDVEDTWQDLEIVEIHGQDIRNFEDNTVTDIPTNHGVICVAVSGDEKTITYTKSGTQTDSFTYKIADSSKESGENSIATVYIYSTHGSERIWIYDIADFNVYEECTSEVMSVSYSVPSNIGDYTISVKQPDNKKGTISPLDLDTSNRIKFTYTPENNKNGHDTFQIFITDIDDNNGQDLYDEKYIDVELDILPVNDVPVFVVWDKDVNNPVELEDQSEDQRVNPDNIIQDPSTNGPIDGITMDELKEGEESDTYYTVVFHDNFDIDYDATGYLENKNLSFELVIADSGDEEPILLKEGVEIERMDPISGKYSAAKFKFNPIANRFGEVLITLKVSDGISTTETQFPLTVTGVNDPPNAPNFTEIIQEDTRFTETLINKGSDIEDLDNVTLSLSVTSSEGTVSIITPDNTVGNTKKGTVELLSDGKTIVYTPNHDAITTTEEPESFTYTITDQGGESTTGTIFVTITNVNDNPTVEEYQYSHTEDEDFPMTIAFTANDVDDAGEVLDFEIISIEDEDGGAFADISDLENIVDDLIQSIETTAVGSGEHSSAMQMVITPKDDQNGSRIIKIRVKDDSDGYTEIEFLVNFTATNDDPVANNDPIAEDAYYQTDEDHSYEMDVLNNDNDNRDDNDELHITAINTAVDENFDGSVSINKDENGYEKIIYTPTKDYHSPENGFMKFEYTISDQFGGTATAEVKIRVESINDNPVAKNDEATTYEDNEDGILIDVLDNDNDNADNDPISIYEINFTDETLTSASGETARVIVTDDGELRYFPAENVYGVDVFTYTITDGNGGFKTAEVTVTIDPVIDVPDIAYDENNPTEFRLYEDIDKEYNIHYYNIEDIYKNVIYTVTSSDETILKDTGIDAQMINNEEDDKDNWIKINFDTVTNMNTGDDGYITIYIEKQIGSKAETDEIKMYVLPVNDSPTIPSIDDILETHEETCKSGSVTGKDIETANEALRYFTGNSGDIDVTSISPYDETQYTTKTPNGTVVIDTNDGEYTYTPDKDFVGEDSFYVYVDDGFRNGNYEIDGAPTTSKKVTVTVTEVNDPPVAVDDSAITPEDVAVTIDVKSNDKDVDVGDNIADVEIIKVSEPSDGSAVVSGGKFIYTPNLNYHGEDEFTYKLDDGNVQNNFSNTVTVTITITSDVDDDPIANDDTDKVDEDSGFVEILVLNNDENPDRNNLNSDVNSELIIEGFAIEEDGDYENVGNVTNGSVKIENNKLYYKPDLNSVASDTFYYKISDGDGDTAIAQVDIEITSINDPPIARDDTATTAEEESVTIDVKANDSDVEDADIDAVNKDKLVLTIKDEHKPANGTVDIKDNGEIKYTPIENFTGEDTFIYTITDSGGASDTATVAITVTPINEMPIAGDDEISVPEDCTDFELDVLANDKNPDRSDLSDPEHKGLTIVSFEVGENVYTDKGRVTNGYVKIVNNKLYYTPDPDYEGEESFKYTIEDQEGDAAIADVTLTVVPGNEIPVVTIPDTFKSNEDQIPTFEVNLGTYVFDEDDDGNWDIEIIDDARHGTVVFDKDTKILTYSSDSNYNGMDSININVKDEEVNVPATINFEVLPTNDAPIGEDDSAEADEDTVVTIDVIINDHDVDNDPSLNTHDSCVPDVLSILESGITGVDNGTVTVDGDNIIFTPDEDWNGIETFTYTVKDSAGLTDTAQVTITINAVDDVVLTNPDSAFSILEDDNDLSNTADILDLVVPDLDGGNTIVSFEYGFDTQTGYVTPNGRFFVDNNNKIGFIPVGDFNGTVTFPVKFTMSDGKTSTCDVSIYIEPQNDPAIARDDFRTTNVNTPVNVAILVNDTDPDTCETLNENPFMFDVEIKSQPSHGVAVLLDTDTSGDSVAPVSAIQRGYNSLQTRAISLVAKGNNFGTNIIPLASDALNQIQVRYTPDTGFYGTDTFVYGFKDGNGDDVSATVTIKIEYTNTSENKEENPKTGHFIFNKIEEFFNFK